MSDLISRIPFFRLLLPAIVAIVVSAFALEISFPLLFCIAGAIVMLVSYSIAENKQFAYRWVFGVGTFVFIFGITTIAYQYRNAQTEFIFPKKTAFYTGTVIDIPQEKPRSFACNVEIAYPVRKKVVLYLQKEDKARSISPGDEVIFVARIQPFKNFGNPDDFDYARFMRNKGFSGTAYITAANWYATGNTNISPYILAQKVRKSALNFYRSFELDDETYSFISALTLGYKHELDDELRAAFRASGTSHVLAVSGLHVSIIYAVFAFLFSFFGRNPKGVALKQTLIIILLWLYAFMTGFSASVIRATIMLTIVCVGLAKNQKGFTYNSLAAAALAILVFNPHSLFDVGFQMSFMAVFFILFFQPKLAKFYYPKNKVKKFIWDLCTVSVAAQMGLAPVVMYYFGAFPTYFFIANLLVVPLVMLIIYCCIPLILITLLKPLQLLAVSLLFEFFRWILVSLINLVISIVYYIEMLPFSQIFYSYLSLPQTILVIAALLIFTIFLRDKRAKTLIATLVVVLLFVLTFTHQHISQKPPQWVVFNKANFSDIGVYTNKKRVYTEPDRNGFISHPSKSILRLSENVYKKLETDNPFNVDVIILSHDHTFSVEQLLYIFQPGQIVLDSSLPQYIRSRLVRECENLGISVHDVVQDGAYLINF